MTALRVQTRAGFTLIEMIVVLVIAGLALTIVAGFIGRRNPTLEASNAASRLIGAMRTARSRALTEGRAVPFALSPDGHSYRVGDALVGLGTRVALAMVGPPAIVFAPDGSASGGSVRVLVDGKERRILVDWLTGRVTIAGAL